MIGNYFVLIVVVLSMAFLFAEIVNYFEDEINDFFNK